MRVLFVCLGNICRSPTAEAAMRALVAQAGLDQMIAVDSAGTGSWHVGEPPDRRATEAAARRGLELDGRARQVGAADFERYDMLVALDRENLRALLRLAPDEAAAARVRLLREFDPDAAGELDVPDPYYGGANGFEDVLDIVERSCRGLLDELRAQVA